MGKLEESSRSNDSSSIGRSPVQDFVYSKVNGIVGNSTKEVQDNIITNKKLENILSKLSLFDGTNSIVGNYLIELHIRRDHDLLDLINNTRCNGFNLYLVLSLYMEDEIPTLMGLEGVEITKEDLYLGQLLGIIKREGNIEINNLLKIEDYIEQIYKNNVADFNVVNKHIDESFLNFLLALYSYYLQFKDSIDGGIIVTHIIFDLISNLLENKKLNFKFDITINYIDELSKGLNDNDFNEGMYGIKKLFLDSINEITSRSVDEISSNSIDETHKPLNRKVSNALNAYNQHLYSTYDK